MEDWVAGIMQIVEDCFVNEGGQEIGRRVSERATLKGKEGTLSQSFALIRKRNSIPPF